MRIKNFELNEILYEAKLFRDIDKSIMELGSQNISNLVEDKDEIEKFFSKYNCKTKISDFSNIAIEDSVSTSYFWKAFGFTEYDSIDTDKRYGHYDYDLNHDLKDKYNFSKQYDLVTNFGTTEHVFNQHSVFKNIHDLCKVDGLMLHSTVLQGYVNHGLYNYHPEFFESLARANHYIIEKYYFYFDNKIWELFEYNEDVFLEKCKNTKITTTNAVCILIIYRKTSNMPFKTPFQSNYLDIINDEKVKDEYL